MAEITTGAKWAIARLAGLMQDEYINDGVRHDADECLELLRGGAQLDRIHTATRLVERILIAALTSDAVAARDAERDAELAGIRERIMDLDDRTIGSVRLR